MTSRGFMAVCHAGRPLILSSAVFFLVTCSAIAAQSGWDDRALYPKPPAPTLPHAGGTYTDPTFGTTILRVTDPSTAPKCAAVNSAAEDSMFNADASLFYLLPANGGAPWLYTLNRATLQVTRAGTWPTTPRDRYILKADGAAWDPTNPLILYAIEPTNRSTRRLWQITWGSTTAPLTGYSMTALHDFANEIPIRGGGTYGRVMVSPDSRYFMVTAGTTGGQDNFDSIVVWDRQTGQSRVLHTTTDNRITASAVKANTGGVHATVLDNSGHYAIISMGDYQRLFVWRWPSDTVSAPLTVGKPTCYGGHHVQGWGSTFAPDTCAGSDVWNSRSLNTPTSVSTLLTYPRRNGKVNWMEDSHSTRLLNTPNGGHSFFESRYAGNFLPGQVKGTFVLHSGAIYKAAQYLAHAPNNLAPEVVRYNGLLVPSVTGVPTAPNQWFYETGTDTLYLWLPDSSMPQSGVNHLTILDWRPMMEEILQVIQRPDGSWTWRRLAHHRSQYTSFANSPRGNADPTGSFILFQSNWDGTLTNGDGSARTDVFLLRVPKKISGDRGVR